MTRKNPSKIITIYDIEMFIWSLFGVIALCTLIYAILFEVPFIDGTSVLEAYYCGLSIGTLGIFLIGILIVTLIGMCFDFQEQKKEYLDKLFKRGKK